MFANLQFVSGHSIPHPFGEMLLFHLNRILITVQETGVVRKRKITLILLCIVQSKSGTDIKSFHRVQVYIRITEQTPISISVVPIIINYTSHILAVGHSTVGTSPIRSIHSVYGNHGKGNHGVTHDIPWSLDFRRTVQSEMLTDSQNIIYHLIITINTCRNTVEVCIFNQTVIFIISQRKEIITSFRSITQRKIVLLNKAGTCDFIKPVRITCCYCIGIINKFGNIDVIQHRIAFSIISPIILITDRISIRILTTVHIGLP